MKKRKIVKWTSIFILVVTIIILFMLSPIFSIKKINVLGNSKVSEAEVLSLLQIPTNENIFKINEKDLTEKLVKNSYIEKIKVSKKLPNILDIEIYERVTNYAVQIVNGYVCIDSYGYILEIANEKPEVPILLGVTTSEEELLNVNGNSLRKLNDIDTEKLKKFYEVIKFAKTNDVLKYITSADITNINDVIMYLDTEEKIVHLGDLTELNIKLLYLKSIVEVEAKGLKRRSIS
jgi:cell division protein FtsQ